jgi:hypothetical protein
MIISNRIINFASLICYTVFLNQYIRINNFLKLLGIEIYFNVST